MADMAEQSGDFHRGNHPHHQDWMPLTSFPVLHSQNHCSLFLGTVIVQASTSSRLRLAFGFQTQTKNEPSDSEDCLSDSDCPKIVHVPITLVFPQDDENAPQKHALIICGVVLSHTEVLTDVSQMHSEIMLIPYLLGDQVT